MAEVTVQQGGQRLKYTVTHHRKQQHTHEAFIKWIVEEHLPVAMPIFKKHGILAYSLVSASYWEALNCPQYFLLLPTSSSRQLLLMAH